MCEGLYEDIFQHFEIDENILMWIKRFCIIETSCVIKILQKTANLSRKMAAILKASLETVFFICIIGFVHSKYMIQCLDLLNMPSHYHSTIKKCFGIFYVAAILKNGYHVGFSGG